MNAPADWVLALDLAGANRLMAVLSNGQWGFEMGEAPWPATPGSALPERIRLALGRVTEGRIRLQLRIALDDWPWEREIAEAAAGTIAVARFLSDLPANEAASVAADKALPSSRSLVVGMTGAGAHLPLLQAARQRGSPLVVCARLTPVQQAGLERALRGLWREGCLLSQALAQAVAQLALPGDACRLYDDAPAAAGGNDIEQGRRPVTAMSIDLVGSTSLMHSVGAEDYARRLQLYHDHCAEVVRRLEGSIDDPRGDDGLMAYFGFPLAVEDAGARALMAAWEVSRGMAEQGLQVRVGVASGSVAVSEQQAFGPAVHLAARLCSAAEPGQILVAGSTRERVGPRFRLEARGQPLRLKDFEQVTEAWRLTGIARTNDGPRDHDPPAAPFIGRRHEFERLERLWGVAVSGRLQWCVVQGEAGIGKSRLLAEFARQLPDDAVCLTLRGQPQDSSSPFAALVDALRSHWSIGQADDPAAVSAQLSRRLPGDAFPDDARSLLEAMLATTGGQRVAIGIQSGRRLADLFLACLRTAVSPGPACLLVDDAHWLDPSTSEVLGRLRQAAAGLPLMVLLGERPGQAGAISAIASEMITLRGLSDAESRQLAAEIGARLPEPVRAQVVARAEGMPLYLEESLRVLSLQEVNTASATPARIEDLMMVRLDSLGPDRALAQLMSVIGRECGASLLDALLAQDDPFVVKARQRGSVPGLVRSGLLMTSDGDRPGYRFSHALLRDAAYESLWQEDRSRLHGLCAAVLERDSPDLVRQRPEILAQHLEAAGRLAAACEAWQAAAKLAAGRHAHTETLSLAQRALTLLESQPDEPGRALTTMRLNLLVASAQVALQGYGSAAVEAAYLAASTAGARLADASQAWRVRLGLEACYVMRGDLTRAGEIAEAAVAASRWEDDPQLALQARWAMANVHFHRGDWRAALAGFDDCLAHYRADMHRPSGVQDPAVMCLGYSSWIHFEIGQADEAMARIDRLLALADQLQHPFSTSVALGFAASMRRLCGDVRGAWPHAVEAVEVCERGGFDVWLAHAWMVRGQLRNDQGDAYGGAVDMDRGYRLWVNGGARISCATYLATRGEILLRHGQTEAAQAELDQAVRISQQIGERHYHAEVWRLRGLCAWQAGDLPLAENLLNEALGLAVSHQRTGLALRCALSLGALEAREGRAASAAQRLAGLMSQLPRHGSCRDMRWAAQALACWQAGQIFQSQPLTPWEPL